MGTQIAISSSNTEKGGSVFTKLRRYGLRASFYRMLVRVIPNDLNYLYYLWRKYIFGYAIVAMNGVKLYLDLKHDDGLSRELIVIGKRERFTVDHLFSSGILKKGATALDVGGNIGYYALPEANLVGPDGIVHAVEPVRGNFELLNKNVELNGFKNIRTHQLAMGDKEGEIEIYVRTKKNLSSLTPLPSDEKGGLIGIDKVRMTTVDSFAENVIGKHPDFVRMDVEGYEASILEGMEKTLRSGATLLIEFHPMFLKPEQKERIIALLKDTGYTRTVVTVNPKGEMNRFLTYLNAKVGVGGKPSGYIKEGDLDFMRTLLYDSPRVFNAFIYH